MATVQLLPPNAPEWIQSQWNVFYAMLQKTPSDAPNYARYVQYLNSLVAQARALTNVAPTVQQVAQQPSAFAQIITQLMGQMRVMLQPLMSSLDAALKAAAVPFVAATRYLGLARAFLLSDAAVAALAGFGAAVLELLVWVLVVIVIIVLLILLYKLLEWIVDSISDVLQWMLGTGKYKTSAQAEAARRIAARDIERAKANFCEVVSRQGGVLAQLDIAWNAKPA